MSRLTGVLLLADGRSPAGMVNHSGGIEEAVRLGVVHDEQTLGVFLTARLHTAGAVSAGLAAAACRHPDRPLRLEFLDAEADARMPSAAAREASRAQGRGLLRLARASWPHPAYAAAGVLGERPHHALVLGVAVAAAGGEPAEAAAVAALSAVTGPASAAVRLLGLDPLAVAGLLARLAARVDAVASEAHDAGELGDAGHPLFDVLAEHHTERLTTLFAS